MVDDAAAFLESVGVPIPDGYTARFGTDTTNGAAGEVKPNDPGDVSQGGEIVINPEGIGELSPNLPGDVTQLGGVIVVVLYHEIKHADGSYSGHTCSEIANQRHTAAKHCELITFILTAVPGADVSPLCTFYDDIQHQFNDGVNTPGGASTAWSDAGCSGSYPGDIPDCESCQ